MNLRRLLLLAQLPFWALLVAAFFFLSSTLDAHVQATERAAQTRSGLTTVARALQHVVDLETGLRGYVITGQPEFLEPYNAARAALPAELAGLGQSNATEGQRLGRIRALITRWQDESAAPQLAARQRSEAEAVGMVKTGAGKKILDSIRAEVAAYTADQTVSLTELDAAASGQLRRPSYGGCG